jgi:hypothetical protein
MTSDRTADRGVAGGFIPLRAYQIGLTLTGFRFLAELFVQHRAYGRKMVSFDVIASYVWPGQKVSHKLDKVIAELCRLNVIQAKPADEYGAEGFTLLNEEAWGKTHEVQSTS